MGQILLSDTYTASVTGISEIWSVFTRTNIFVEFTWRSSYELIHTDIWVLGSGCIWGFSCSKCPRIILLGNTPMLDDRELWFFFFFALSCHLMRDKTIRKIYVVSLSLKHLHSLAKGASTISFCLQLKLQVFTTDILHYLLKKHCTKPALFNTLPQSSSSVISHDFFPHYNRSEDPTAPDTM